MGGLKNRFGLTTDEGTNALIPAVLAVALPWLEKFEPSTLIWFVPLLLTYACVILWLMRGSDAAVSRPDAGQEDAEVEQSLGEVLDQGRLGLIQNSARVSRRVNQAGLELIKSFEGCRLKAYRCPAGVWTIGYGHTGRDVVAGLMISQETADELLRDDLAKFEAGVVALVGSSPTNDNQFSALVSFAFNCGLGALAKSSVLVNHKSGRKQAAAASFGKWVKGGGRVLPGLVRRRAAEKALYLA